MNRTAPREQSGCDSISHNPRRKPTRPTCQASFPATPATCKRQRIPFTNRVGVSDLRALVAAWGTDLLCYRNDTNEWSVCGILKVHLQYAALITDGSV